MPTVESSTALGKRHASEQRDTGMMSRMGLVWLLVIVVLVRGVVDLVKYLSGRQRFMRADAPASRAR